MSISLLKTILLAFVLLLANSTFSQYNETIRTSRPGFAIVPFTVGARVLQVQAGLDYYSLTSHSPCDVGKLRSTFFTKPCNTFPGPTSINSVIPSAIICCMVCVHLTGEVS